MTPIQFFGTILVAFLWGGTNPFLRQGSKPVATMESEKPAASILGWFFGLWTRRQFLIPFVLNQSGSIVYAGMLSTADLTVVVPVCNSLTFVITAVTSYLLGEPVASAPLLVLGSVLVTTGTFLCSS